MADGVVSHEANVRASADGGDIRGWSATEAAEVGVGEGSDGGVVVDGGPLADVFEFGLGDAVNKELGETICRRGLAGEKGMVVGNYSARKLGMSMLGGG